MDATYQRQRGECPGCRETFPREKMEGDHIRAWSDGGKTVVENCQMLCGQCNLKKSNH